MIKSILATTVGVCVFALAGCSSGETLPTALEIQQIVSKSSLPCFDQTSKTYDEGIRISCNTEAEIGGQYYLFVFADTAIKEEDQLLSCANHANGKEELSDSLVQGINWYATTSGNSIVTPQDLAREIGGEVTTGESVCANFGSAIEEKAKELLAADQGRVAEANITLGKYEEKCLNDQNRLPDAESILTIQTRPETAGIPIGIGQNDDLPDYFCATNSNGELQFPLPGGGTYTIKVPKELLPEGIEVSPYMESSRVLVLTGGKTVFVELTRTN